MPTTIKDVNGVEHVVHSQEEIDAKVKEGVATSVKEGETKTSELKTAHETAMTEKTEEIVQLNKDMDTAKQSLKDADEGTVDWNSARKQIGDLETKLTKANEGREKDKEEFTKEIRGVRTSIFAGTVEKMLDGLSGEDKELRDKIEHHYNRLNSKVENEKQATEAMKDAFMLATGKNMPDTFNVARGSGGGQAPTQDRNVASKAGMELGQKFGISEADYEKYNKTAQEKKPQRPTN